MGRILEFMIGLVIHLGSEFNHLLIDSTTAGLLVTYVLIYYMSYIVICYVCTGITHLYFGKWGLVSCIICFQFQVFYVCVGVYRHCLLIH